MIATSLRARSPRHPRARWRGILAGAAIVAVSFSAGMAAPGVFAERPDAVLYPREPVTVPTLLPVVGEEAVVREYGPLLGTRLWTVVDDGVRCVQIAGPEPVFASCERDDGLATLLTFVVANGRLEENSSGIAVETEMPEGTRVLLRIDGTVEVWTMDPGEQPL